MGDTTKQSRRFVVVSAIELGIPCSVSVAADEKFDNALVCILTISREEWVNAWMKTAFRARCCIYHPHILTLYDVFLCGEEIRVIFEHPRGVNLLLFLQRCQPNENIVRHLFQQLIFAVEYYHHAGVDGLDLTLERVFCNLQSGILKLIDFGLTDATPTGTRLYSLPYVAPEQLRQHFTTTKHNKASDVWHCGVLLYCMLFRSFPFCPTHNSSKDKHIHNILNARWSIPATASGTVSSECIELLRRMLTLDPDERITLSQIKKHPWYSRDLPEGVLQYRFLERPHDGLIEKVEVLRGCWAAQSSKPAQ